ncbi:MAG: ATPase [Bdellovibrionaceae bacterium]|nr:ATPase [Pseudobdellovibrionaceae bacterium]|tara:strand:- start:574 stop:1491 length:918 start_codon:yes stop_codon:yes gene_type:complete
MKKSQDNPPLKVQNLSKFYGSLQAVNQVTFEVQPGEVFGLLGPNGAGKTSIISTIVTLEEPTQGKIEIFGHDVQKDPLTAKSYVGWVPQEVINHGFFNICEIIKFHSGYFGKSLSEEETNQLLKRLDLYNHRHKKVKQLSGGMKRRLMIAKALCHNPKILLLDEPTAGVDIDLRKSLWDFVKELRSQGVAILLTTHYLEEAENLCDRVGFLSHGRILRIGQTSEIVTDLTEKTIELILDRELPELKNSWVQSQKGNEIHLKVPMTKGVFEGVRLAGIDLSHIKDIRVKDGDLEDAFRRVMKEGQQ